MSWFSETRVIPSEKNTSISVRRRFGVWQVSVDGIEQTGPEVHEFWKYALDTITRYQGVQKISKILMLGLGAGGEVRGINTQFPGASVTAIEYDPAMITLAKELKLYRPFPFPTVICKDAAEAVPKLEGRFDLIIIDLFKGAEPSPLANDRIFLSALDAKLSGAGFLLVNVYRNESLLQAYEQEFLLLRKWRFGLNYFGLFQRKTVSTYIERGYLPVRQWTELNTLDLMPKFSAPSRIGKNDEGVYWKLWPFSFESYIQDTEPDIVDLPKEKKKPIRIIMWQRRRYRDVPEGWLAFSGGPFLKVGFVPLDNPSYARTWNESAQRELKKWKRTHEGSRYTLRALSYGEFAEGYLRSTLPFLMKRSMLYEVEVRTKNSKIPVLFWGVERVSDKKIVAGLCAMESPSLGISYYLAGFYIHEAKDDPVMTGLFDFWIQDAMRRKLKFIDFGNFWKSGDDSTWKGFSMFKSKFNPFYFFYPEKLFRFSFWDQKS